jgi:opacity protein-like surface antigen
MKRKKINLMFVVNACIIVLTSHSVYAQGYVSDVSKRGTTAAQFLSINQGARAAGMGSAFVAVADDPTALYWNPAGLTKVQGGAVVFEHVNWIADIKYDFFAASYNIGSFGTLGISFLTSNIEDMQVRTILEPEGTGETFGISDVMFSVAYAINLTDNFSIGFNPKFINQKIWRTNATAFAIDMGVQYTTPFDGMILAMSISNFGTKMKLDGTSALVLYDPDQNSTGNNERIPAYLQTDQWELPLNFRVGVSYKPFSSSMHKLLLAIDAMHPSDNYESLNLGCEYIFNDLFFLRGGYKSLFLRDSEESYTFGAGILQRFIGNVALKIDYSFGDFGRLKNVQRFSVGISF